MEMRVNLIPLLSGGKPEFKHSKLAKQVVIHSSVIEGKEKGGVESEQECMNHNFSKNGKGTITVRELH